MGALHLLYPHPPASESAAVAPVGKTTTAPPSAPAPEPVLCGGMRFGGGVLGTMTVQGKVHPLSIKQTEQLLLYHASAPAPRAVATGGRSARRL